MAVPRRTLSGGVWGFLGMSPVGFVHRAGPVVAVLAVGSDGVVGPVAVGFEAVVASAEWGEVAWAGWSAVVERDDVVEVAAP